MKEPSQEATLKAAALVNGCGLIEQGMGMGNDLQVQSFKDKIARALDDAWRQGFEDCETKNRLQRMGLLKGMP